MKFTNIKKAFVLLSFVTLVTAFVLYRAGVFDKYINPADASIQSSPNGGTMNNNSTDTLSPQKKDSAYAERLKSIREGKPVKKNTTKETPIMWSGSKSAHIITPIDFKPFFPDSTKRLDSSQIKKDTAKIKVTETRTVIMGSSKSGAIFKPADNELLRIIKLYQGDSAGLRRALERYSGRKN